MRSHPASMGTGASALETVEHLGGVASRRQLMELHGRGAVERLLVAGDLVAAARGRLALPHGDEARRAAYALSGLVSHASAAMAHGWEVAVVPPKPHITVPRGRRVSAEQRRGAVIHFARRLPPAEGLVTAPEVTLGDCLRSLSPAEALAVADSALRQGVVGASGLAEIADRLRGTGAPQARRVAQLATVRAANPFESVLRFLALKAGLDVEPQVELPELGMTPDLVDRKRRLVLEADSFEWHGKRKALMRDARRYNAMVINGWVVLRFCWEDVMFDRGYVLAVLRDAARMLNR